MQSSTTLTLLPASFQTALAIPLASFSVSAGFPSPADDYLEGTLDLNEYFIRHPAATFYVRVSGDSMRGAGIQTATCSSLIAPLPALTARSSSPAWAMNSR